MLKQRLQRANENNIGNTFYNQPQKKKYVENAVIHYKNIGIINSWTKIEDIVSLTKVHAGWKVASIEVGPDPEFTNVINQNFISSIKNQNSELKRAAIETKKYAEKVKQENDALKLQLEKANKKIKSIELARGFEKWNDELLNKWEKIFTNWLIEVSKERGRREAQKDFKKFKSEFKKVIELNTNLQAQIESLSEYRMMKDSSPSTTNNGKEPIIGNLIHSPININFDVFKTANNYKNSKAMKENINMYMTENNNPHTQRNNKFIDSDKLIGAFPNPPLINKDDDTSDNFFLSSMVDKNSDCNTSNNEIENIIMSDGKEDYKQKQIKSKDIVIII